MKEQFSALLCTHMKEQFSALLCTHMKEQFSALLCTLWNSLVFEWGGHWSNF
jgi:hypothetical protein